MIFSSRLTVDMKRRHLIERPITHGHQEGVQDRAILVGRAVRLRGVLHVRFQMLGKADRLPSPQPLLAFQGGDPMLVAIRRASVRLAVRVLSR